VPELPEVEVSRQYLEATSLHQEVAEVDVRDAYVVKDVDPDELDAALRGRKLIGGRRHGKLLFVQTDGDPWLLLHFGMSGFLEYHEDPDETSPYPRVLFRFRGGAHLDFDNRRKLGQVRLVEDPDDYVHAKGLGPDALSKSLDRQGFVESLRGRRGTLKSALMNQEILAGVGNEFSDEILFQRRLHPRTKVASLDDEALGAVYDTLRTTLDAAIDARMKPEQLPSRFLLRHRNEGGTCPRCEGDVARVEVSGRGANFCPSCQGEEASGERSDAAGSS
jgi:formamidopyrimidine-DNA glycosylase